jgi:hypothetical protein
LYDANAELCFRIGEMVTRLYTDPEGVVDALEALALETIPRFRAAGDDLGHCTANFAVGMVAHWRLQRDVAAATFEQTLAHARRLGLQYRDGYLNAWIASRVNSAESVPDLIAWLEAQGRLTDPSSRTYLAIARAMAGQIEEARAELAAVRDLLAERGMRLFVAERLAMESVLIECWRAILRRRSSSERKAAGSWRSWASALGCRPPPAVWRRCCASSTASTRPRPGRTGRESSARATTLQRRRFGARQRQCSLAAVTQEAERLIREAVAITEPTQELNYRADSLVDVGAVLERTGKPEDAPVAFAARLSTSTNAKASSSWPQGHARS